MPSFALSANKAVGHPHPLGRSESAGNEIGRPGHSSWGGALSGCRGPDAVLLGDGKEDREDIAGPRRGRPSSHSVASG